MQDTTVLLVLVAGLQIKHLIGDFYLQTAAMLEGREKYLHAGRALHALVHAVGSTIVLLLMATPLIGLLALVVAEFIVHFHIDWWKANLNIRKQLSPDMAPFWHALGLDQALHQLTYLVMAWVWIQF